MPVKNMNAVAFGRKAQFMRSGLYPRFQFWWEVKRKRNPLDFVFSVHNAIISASTAATYVSVRRIPPCSDQGIVYPRGSFW
jgi:hypothetical protein